MFNLFSRKKTIIAISPSIVIFTTVFLFVLLFLYKVREILITFFLGFIVMVALTPAIDKLQRKIKSRSASIIIVYLLLFVVFSSIFALLVPPLAVQLTQLLRAIQLPFFQDELTNLKFTAQELYQLANSYGSSINTVFSIINSTFRSLFTFFTLLVVSFYLTIDEPNLYKKIGWFTNNKHHFEIARQFLNDIEEQLGGWIRGQIIVMTMIGTITYLGLQLIGIPFALPLGILAMMLEILPNLGPTLAAVPGIIIAWVHGDHTTALIVLIFYIVLQQIESNIITPRIMKANADVNSLISILSILSGFTLAGVVGGLLAIPVYIIIRTCYGYYRKHQDQFCLD
ncbi:MAG TPA: AI-2E family transporter [Candidatus Woesebacteria bacterium]|nr:AI-2E family transporter [Candidatus Woesebacteria bacterium]